MDRLLRSIRATKGRSVVVDPISHADVLSLSLLAGPILVGLGRRLRRVAIRFARAVVVGLSSALLNVAGSLIDLESWLDRKLGIPDPLTPPPPTVEREGPGVYTIRWPSSIVRNDPKQRRCCLCKESLEGAPWCHVRWRLACPECAYALASIDLGYAKVRGCRPRVEA